MIHVDVPDTKTLVERSDGITKYTAYNIHINGWYHGSVRFSHLYEFAELIKQKFSQRYKGPEFPAKKLFKLDPKAIDERRQKITKYFQALVQHPEVARHYLVEKKLLGFQIDSFRATSQYVTLDVFLGNGEKTTIKCLVSDSTLEIMKIICEKLGFKNKDQFIYHFGLFMAKGRDPTNACYSVTTENFNPLLTRFLRNFEAPFVSLSTANQKYNENGHYHFLCLRKLIWDSRVEEPLLDDGNFVELLYKQAMQDYKNGHMDPVKEDLDSKLKSCMARNDSKMFLRTCHQLSTYSYEIMSPCSCDYPKPGTPCEIKFGRRQIIMTTRDETGKPKPSIFRATRIRVWRITQVMDKISFQFEYLMAKDTFEWITLDTDQSILMSLLLQSIGSEILYEHNNMTIEQQVMKEKHSKGNYVEKSEKLPRDPKKPIIVLKNEVEDTDPLGVMEHYHNYNRMLTTISDGIPQRNQAFTDITNDDL
ncbi:PX domain-containing protein [Caenorhabditis elegans]|nr:PX domain-containing protein [Caenorhabditis elegans]CAL36496.1 PX domain-containing protein [Caenorhabditis elegans]|eukprot:NP_001076763.1 Sorting nexin-17 homolog [Caenorhabditis elegans]